MGITDTVRGLVKILMLILTGITELIMFAIDLEIGTWACVITQFIHGFLAILDETVGLVLGAVNEAMKDIVNGLADALDALETALDKFVSFVKTISFGQINGIPSVDDVSNQVQDLRNFNGSVPISKITGWIDDINKDIPDINSVTAEIQAVISLPFNTIKALLNESLGNWTMDPSLFPTASKQTLSFCTGNDGITDFFDVLFTIVKNAKIIAIVGLILLAIGSAAFMAWWEIKRYRRTVAKAQTFLEREPMDVVYIAGRPLTARSGIWVSEKLSKDPKRQMLIRWCIAYATTYTALFVLSLAIAGGFSVLFQYLTMRAIQKEAPALTTQVGDFVGQVVGKLDQASEAWSNDTNHAISDVADGINNHVLYYVVNGTGALTKMIDAFKNKTQTFMEGAFGHTKLGNFTDGMLGCFSKKLDEVEDAIEWVHDNAHVSFPEMPSNLFSFGANDTSNSSLTSIVASSSSATADDITGALDKVIATLQTGIITEGLIALVLLLVYVAYVFFAVAQAALRMCCIRERYATLVGDKTLGRYGL